MSNNTYSQFRGEAGEIEVARILSGFNRQQYIVLNNILLRKQYVKSGEVPTVQIDHLVVSLYGIFSIETKNYAGKIYGYEDARTWKVYLAGQKYEMQNPLRQNHAHTKTLQKLLMNNAMQIGIQNADFLIYPIIAFSERADLSKIQVQGVDIVHYNQIPTAILNKSVTMQLTPQQMESIAQFISSQNIYSPENMRKHIDDIRRLKGDDINRKNDWAVTVGNPGNVNQNIQPQPTISNPLTEAEQYREEPVVSFEQFTSDNPEVKYSAKRKSGKGWIPGLVLGIGIPLAFILLVFLLVWLLTVFFKGIAGMSQNINQQVTNNMQNTTSSTLTTQYQNSEQTSWEAPGENERPTVNPESIPEEMDITKVDRVLTAPRSNVTNGIVYICHGSYQDEEYEKYTDKDGEIYDGFIGMFYHNAWSDIYLDLNAESYNTLKFKYVGPSSMFYDYTVLKIKVYDRDTEELIYECEKAKKDHSQDAEIDITGHDHIRLVFIDEHNGGCYCYLKDIILSDPVQ